MQDRQNIVDEGQIALAKAILRVVVVGLAVVMAIALIDPKNDDFVTIAFYGPLLAILGLANWAMSRGKIAPAGQILTLLFFVTAVGAVVVLGGIRANATASFLVCIMVAAALLNTRWAVIWTGLSVLAVSILAAIELAGAFPEPLAPPDSMGNAFMGSLLPIVFAVFILHRMIGLRQDALQEAADRERERDKAEADLIQAQKMDVVGRLTSGIAHDFNNLLTVIHSSVDVLKLEGHDDPLLDDIEHSANRASMLTSRLLAFARPTEAESTTVNLSSELNDFSNLLQTVVGDEIHLDLDVQGNAWATVDPLGFQQILLNLVINAREAMGARGRIRVAIETNGAESILRVRDTGPGLPDELKERVFEPFFTTKESGTGLGLSTVRQLVEDSNGRISASNHPDGGAEFVIYWRRPEAQPLREVSDVSETPNLDFVPKILVVDDNDPVRRAMASLLVSRQWQVFEASDGLEALSVLERQKPDLVITDVSMPGITGVELARRIREIHEELPILIVSGNPLEEVPVERCLFLPKPFGAERLERSVLDLLQTTRGSQLATG